MVATNTPTISLNPLSSSSSSSSIVETPLYNISSCKSLCLIPTSTSFPSTYLSTLPTTNKRRNQFSANVAFNPQGNFDLPILDDDNNLQSKAPEPMPPKEGRFEVVIDNDIIQRLDLSPFEAATSISSPYSVDGKEYLDRTIGFTINYTKEDPYDQRELSEFPNIRLWFVRLDATYPWLPVLLDWRAGELARYAAMLVPHQMSMKMGVVFNPEALELFIMKKVFIVYLWLKEQGFSPSKARLKTNDMARMLGFGIGDDLFDLMEQHPNSSPD